MKRLNLLAISLWLIIGIYGIFYNITYIDEAKYLIKGWLIATGQVGYYSTTEFFYQHMPGALLWYGLGQKIFGPNLLVARLQSFTLGLMIVWISFKMASGWAGKKAGVITLMLLSLAPVICLYYSIGIPQSPSALTLALAFYCLWKKRFIPATVFFSLALVIRENFLFSWLFYLIFITWKFKRDAKQLLANWLTAGITMAIFIAPGWPGIGMVFTNFPGVSAWLPIGLAQKQVLGLYWRQSMVNDLILQIRALITWGAIFHAWLLAAAIGVFLWWKRKKVRWFKDKVERNFFWFFIGVTLFNTLAHVYSAFQLSPRAIISYSSYVGPQWAVILAFFLSKVIRPRHEKNLIRLYFVLIPLATIGIWLTNFTSIKKPMLTTINEAVARLKPQIDGYDKIVWINEPMILYLAGKVSYYPLINHINFYKNSADTATVRNLGFWNLAMLAEWFEEADLIVIGNNKLKLLKESQEGIPAAQFIEERLSGNFQFKAKRNDIWPDVITFYDQRLSPESDR